jgi:hypothetical protein
MMNVFTIHLPPEDRTDGDPLPIREGFSWPAFFFTFFWALWHRLWLVALGLFVLLVVISLVLEISGIDPAARLVITLGVYSLIGFVANDVRRWWIERRGWRLDSVVTGLDADEAVWRWAQKSGAQAA